MATVQAASDDPAAARPVRRTRRSTWRRSTWRRSARRLARDPVTLLAAAILAAIFLMAILAPLLATYDPYVGSALRRLRPIGTPGHWLGTDEIGRDIYTRLLYGGRLSLLAGVTPVGGALVIGGSLGLLAGYSGGWINTLIMRGMDMFYAFPSVLLAVAICAIVGAGLTNTVIALTIVFIPPIVRLTESVTTQIRNLDYVLAARASGASTVSVLARHVLGNVLGPILVYATSLVGLSIILAAGLTFLGLGVPPPEPEWGAMLSSLRQAIYVAPVNAALPGAMIFVTSLCFNLVSDGLRHALDIRALDATAS
jgi:peptide/nickel transport system permease protein